MIWTWFELTFGTLEFDEKTFFKTLLRFTPYWDNKHTNAIQVDSPGVYTSEKLINMSTLTKYFSKCDVIDGSVVNGFRQPLLYSFVLDKLPVYKIFCERETIHHWKNEKNCSHYYIVLFRRWWWRRS